MKNYQKLKDAKLALNTHLWNYKNIPVNIT